MTLSITQETALNKRKINDLFDTGGIVVSQFMITVILDSVIDV